MNNRRFAVLALVSCFAAVATAAPVAAGTKNYQVRLLRTDQTLNQPVSDWSYFMDLRRGFDLVGTPSLNLHFGYSQTLNANQSTLTILVNDQPVASRAVPKGTGDARWNVALPAKFFREGFNEIRLRTRQRSSEGPCQDEDNAANWLRVQNDTTLNLARKLRPAYPLFAYPFPYLDPLAPSAVQSTLRVGKDASADSLAEMLSIATDWGVRETNRGLPITVTTGRGSANTNVVEVGELKELGNARSLPADAGLLATGAASADTSFLTIAGADAKGLGRAVEVLSRPDLSRQLPAYGAVLTGDAPKLPADALARLGTFTLRDLGQPQIALRGAFRQQQSITVRRPIRVDLGKESTFTIRFRHAAVSPDKSSLSVVFNGTPVASVRLTDDNANNGVLTARIPTTELAKNLWQIDFVAFHDIKGADCTKTYDDVAWTVIDGTSGIELARGGLKGRPYLDGFPYLLGKDGVAPATVTMNLSKSPSDVELSLAGTVAARAGQANRVPLNWTVQKGEALSGKGSSIVIGKFSDASRWSALKGKLLVSPNGDGFDIDPRLQLLPSALKGAGLIQAVPSPTSVDGVSYVIMAEDDATLDRIGRLLSDPLQAEKLTGEATLLTSDGRILPLLTPKYADLMSEATAEADRYTAPMVFIAGIIAALVVGFLVWLASRFVKRAPKAA